MINEERILTKDELARRVGEDLLLEEEEEGFELSSGKESDFYVDIKALGDHPDLQKSFSYYVDQIINEEELGQVILAGEGMGGTATVPPLAAQTGRKWAQLRSERKDYGTENHVEGAEVEGQDVLYVDDVVTTGASAVEGIYWLQRHGANVVGFLTYVDRQEEGDVGMEGIEAWTGVDTYSVLNKDEVYQEMRES